MRSLRLDGRRLHQRHLGRAVLVKDAAGLRKGHRLQESDLEVLRAERDLHLVLLGPNDVHEDLAATRLARAVAGVGVGLRPPRQSQVRLVAATRGMVEVDLVALEGINRIPDVSVFTLPTGSAVETGQEVGGAKITPVAIPAARLARAERCAGRRPVLQVLEFRPLRSLVAVTEKLKPRAREAFRAAVTRKLGWYGAQLVAEREIGRTPQAMREVYREALWAQAQLVLIAGASAIDPLDPAFTELRNAKGKLLARGLPAHPGSMIWVGALSGATVLGVASCAGFERNTALDLVLPFLFAEGKLLPAQLARLGHGGFIESGPGRRFPPYS